MKIRFKSKEARDQYTKRSQANKIMAEFMGMNWWPAENIMSCGTIEVVDPSGDCIELEGFYMTVFKSERQYFDIVV